MFLGVSTLDTLKDIKDSVLMCCLPSLCQLSDSAAQTDHDHDPYSLEGVRVYEIILLVYAYSGLHLPDNLRLLAQHWATTVAEFAPRVLAAVLDGNPARGLTFKCSLCSPQDSTFFNGEPMRKEQIEPNIDKELRIFGHEVQAFNAASLL